jgi:hypothetical protein
MGGMPVGLKRSVQADEGGGGSPGPGRVSCGCASPKTSLSSVAAASGSKERRVGRVVHVPDDEKPAVRACLGGDDRRCNLALALAEVVRTLPLRFRVGRVEGHEVALQVIVEEGEEPLAPTSAQDLDLEQVAREDGLSGVKRVWHVLPGGHPAKR